MLGCKSYMFLLVVVIIPEVQSWDDMLTTQEVQNNTSAPNYEDKWRANYNNTELTQGSLGSNTTVIASQEDLTTNIYSTVNMLKNVRYARMTLDEVKMIQYIHRINSRYVRPWLYLLGIVGSLLAFLTLLLRAQKHTAHIYMGALALSDLFGSVAGSAFSWLDLLCDEGWSTVSCTALYYIALPCLYVGRSCLMTSNLLAVALAADRYVVVRLPLRRSVYCIPRRAYKIGLSIFIISLAICIHFPIRFKPIYVYNESTKTFTSVVIYWTRFGLNNAITYIFTYLEMIIRFVIPLFCLAWFNIALVHSLAQNRKKRKAIAESSADHTSKAQNQLVLITIFIIIFFFLTQTIEFVKQFLFQFAQSWHFTFKMELLIIIQYDFLVLNLCVNFFIYIGLSPAFRKMTLSLFQAKKVLNKSTEQTTSQK